MVAMCIDPNDGGATHIYGLMRSHPRVPRDPYAMPTFSQLFWSASAVATLGAGYVGSSVVGFLFIVGPVRPFRTDERSSAHVGVYTPPTIDA